MPGTKIKETLLKLGVVTEATIELFSVGTRDSKSIRVFRDARSRVIFIDDFFLGKETLSNESRDLPQKPLDEIGWNFEDILDTDRRLKSYQAQIANKSLLDFGCEAGSFLKRARNIAKSVSGVELNRECVNHLNSIGIRSYYEISQVDESPDIVTMFHCLEHLPDPLQTLIEIHRSLPSEGKGHIIVEVPHARDFLIEHLASKSFINFTLWSQHLILHTRESLSLLLTAAGFKNIVIEGVQRYGLSNHMHWLSRKMPGGHKTPLAIIDTPSLTQAYADSLSRLDANDTIVAIAST